MKKFKKTLALAIAFVMAVSVMSVAPTTTVNAAPSKYVKSLKVNKSKVSINSGKSAKVKATVKVKGSANKKVKVKLTAANKKVVKSVKVGKPNKKGVSTITINAKGLTKTKSTTISVVTNAKNKNGKKITKKIRVTVKAAQPSKPAVVEATSVSLTAAKTTINVGEATVAKAVVYPENAQDKSVTYSSSAPAVATVNNMGVITGISEGTAVITAKTSNGKTASVTIKVTQVGVTGITLDKTTANLFVTGTTTLKATVSPANATNKTVIWKSSNEAVAIVNVDGVVTAVAEGTAVITATASNGLTADCTVTVTKKTVVADGVSIAMINPYEDINGKEYANTTLVGDDMTIQTRVVKGGQPLGNINVNLKMEPLYGNLPYAFEIRQESITTNSNGYANFTVGLKSGYNYNAVSNYFQSFTLKATESGTNQSSEDLTVKFGSISLSGVSVLNGQIPYPAIVPSDNASEADTGIASTYYLDDTKVEEFVSSQQVSSFEDDHRVYFSASPYLISPATSETAHLGDWEYKFGPEGVSGPCSVYNDASNETTTVQVSEIPAGLNFITVEFDSISLSKYTKMNIEVRDSLTGGLAYSYNKEVTTDLQESEAIQIPIQKDFKSYLVISLLSEGQVDTTHTGYVVTRLVGNWASTNDEMTTVEEIPNSVTWSDITNEVIYETAKWSYDEAVKYLPADSEHLKEEYKYTLKIPAYPKTGDAVIVVKDADDKEIANYLYPTENGGKNTNVLAPASDYVKAIMVSIEESTASVGTLKTEGNIAIVDSQAAGKTALKAEVRVAGLDAQELNSQNGGVLYTSVQWAPVPNREEAVAEIPDFYAIEGQDVVVVAQLYDKNGNMKTTSGEAITFMVGEGEVDLTPNNSIGVDTIIQDVSNNGNTDTTGTVTLKLRDVTSNTTFSVVNNLTATSENYNVRLSVGGQAEVAAADIYWVDLGLEFTDSAVEEDNPQTTFGWIDEVKDIAKTAKYTVSDTNGWQIADLPIARVYTFDYKHFAGLDGVEVKYSNDNENVKVEQANSVATLSTVKACKTILTGKLNIPDSSKVVFNFYDAAWNLVSYPNVGTGDMNITNTGLALTTEWETNGIQTDLIAPKNIYSGTATSAYVLVYDIYGNPIKDARVEYSITMNNETGSGVTDAKGMYKIKLPAVTLTESATAVLSVTVNGSNTLKESANINYIYKNDVKAFELRNEDNGYSVTVADDKKTINVYFTNEVNEETINLNQFSFVQDGSSDNIYKVESAKRSTQNNCIVLTLDKPLVNSSAAHTLSIASYTDTTTGVVYTITDTNGQLLTDCDYNIPAQRY